MTPVLQPIQIFLLFLSGHNSKLKLYITAI